ncbi:helix-turn-helix transcriptional regulator [Mycobacterium sp. NPDC050853]|uniref:helix-turn-helix domain-containing protein n=1 Tax=Mycobacterium sp. NPDC050853 TaxID=3155160 RepID=UPI0033D901F4
MRAELDMNRLREDLRKELQEVEMVRMGATIKALREAYGWQVGKFAIAIGTTHPHLSNIESGRRRCTPVMARKVAQVLGVPLAAITSSYTPEEIGA